LNLSGIHTDSRSADVETPTFRIGLGYDVHRLAEHRKLVLGGVEIPSDRGLDGHSDADVLLHAIMDALLGAAALGDIGKHFPPSDPQYKDISSALLLRHVSRLVKERGYSIVNIDATVILERPKIAPYIDRMCAAIAEAAGIDPGQVSVKATTNEGLDAFGAGLGAAAHAVALARLP
jgi:2-C-methyl-D-erythritol 2,4-cyclodiphosphate synthase